MNKEKVQKYKSCLYKSLLLYTVLSYGYLAAVASSSADNTSTAISVFARELLSNNAVLLLFSLVFGFSFLIFTIKGMPNAAKWTIHIVLLYASMLLAFLSMARVGADPRSKVLFIFISTLIFAVLYSISALIVHLYKRKRR
ncbi:MAG: hypothetical protein CVU97_02055 [Firmicutes bacterium HGW-Firmicutes-21]|nr:MAG: hypothetical protein CVU97_02055 [Firmicutes bacterium HGW-Firmicutes-21]